jgi:ABC-type dipeptide/oligopeptide/nickel transport system permease subunit
MPRNKITHRGFLRQTYVRFKRNNLSLFGGYLAIVFIILALFAGLISPYDPNQIDFGARLEPPSPKHFFGTDEFGRDILSRVIHGTRISLEIGFAVLLVSVGIGVPLGAIAGLKSNTWIDETIMRLMDIIMVFPAIILAIALMGALGIGDVKIGPFNIPNILKVMAVIGLVYIPRFARVTRGSFLTEIEKDYVLAARLAGAGQARIIFKEILINCTPPIIVQSSIRIATAILTETSLSFLGLGVQPPQASWGGMLSDARGFIISGEWWLILFPSLALILAMLSFNVLGDGLRDALDPKIARELKN